LANFAETVRNMFSSLFARSSAEDRIATYLIREHERGRTVHEIIEDPYVTNRLSREQISRVLERPEIIHALGEATAAGARADI
jgi:hypothetical protein